ncbi:N-glycosylase/DNA lyase [Stetteria hydrogenophila]
MAVTLNRRRAEAVGDALRLVGAAPVLRLEELDPQYAAVRAVAEALGEGPALVAAFLTALSTYRLAMRGEEYWACFARHLAGAGRVESVGGAVEAVKGFLRSCPGARVQLEAKVRRVERAAAAAGGILSALLRDPGRLAAVYGDLVGAVARALGQKPTAKTIVFAVKMAYYATRPPGARDPSPIRIPMPVDVRVACLTYSSAMVDAGSYREIVSRPEPAQEAWSIAAHVSGIPEIHLDTLAWLAGAAARDAPDPAGEIEALLTRAGAPREAARLAAELTVRSCRPRRATRRW